MITMEMLGRIRRMYVRDKLSLHEITKRTGMSRNTVRRWLRTAEEVKVPAYECDHPNRWTDDHVS